MVWTLTNGIKSSRIDFSWKNRDNVKIFQEFGETVIDIAKKIPGGILIFFPSFLMINSLMKFWEKHSIFSQIRKYKSVFIEANSRGETKRRLESYEFDVNSNKGSIFIGTSVGHAIHNFNFSNNGARCIIIAGVPFGNRTEIKRNLVMASFNQRHLKKLSNMNSDSW